MSGDLLVVQKIAAADVDQPVKRCLQELFMHELENRAKTKYRFTENYQRVIAKHAPGWAGNSQSSGAEQ